VLVSDAIWRRRFGGDPSVIGRAVQVNGRAVTVAGVMPPGFRFPARHDLWLPYDRPRDQARAERFFLGLALLADGVTFGEAQAELDTIAGRLAARYPESNREWGLHVMGLRDLFVSAATRGALSAMLAAVGLVLLVGAINVASLLLARGVGRERELTVRAALGAGRARLVRLLFAESVLLAAAGGFVGLLFASWGLDALLSSMAEPPPYWVHTAIDGRVMVFVTGLAFVTSLVCGLLPAYRTSRVHLVQGLADGSRAVGATPANLRLQGGLVVGQVALSLVLLLGATLLMRSTMRLQYADAGFDLTPLLSLRIYLAGDRYDPPEAKSRALRDITDRVRSLPGVSAAGFTSSIPADDGGLTVRAVPERSPIVQGEETGVQMMATMPEFWAALALDLLDGRTFTDAEALDPAADVVIVNRRLADLFWPGETALGRRIGIVQPEGPRWLRVVGVAPDLVYEEFGEETAQSRFNVFVPYGRLGWRTMALLVRTSGDPAALIGSVRRTLHQVDPAIAPYDVMTMWQRRAFTQWGERFLGQMFAAFAITALLMACLGTYGVTSSSAGQRTREVGVRLALGAKAGDVVWLFMRRGITLTAIGLVLGVPLAVATARALGALLYDVSPWSPAVWAGVPLALVGVILTASYLPARRASQTDPAVALRQE